MRGRWILHPEEWVGLHGSSCGTIQMWMVAERGEEEDKEEEQMEVVEGLTGMEEEMKNRGNR